RFVHGVELLAVHLRGRVPALEHRVQPDHHLLEEARALAPFEERLSVGRADGIVLRVEVLHHERDRDHRREGNEPQRREERPLRDERGEPQPREEEHHHERREEVRVAHDELQVTAHDACPDTCSRRLSSPLERSFSMSRRRTIRSPWVASPAMNEPSTSEPSWGAGRTSLCAKCTTSETASTTNPITRPPKRRMTTTVKES